MQELTHHQQEVSALSSKEDCDLIENYLSKPLCVPDDSLEDLPYIFDFGENPISLKHDQLLDHPSTPLPKFDFDFDFQFDTEFSHSSMPKSLSKNTEGNDCNISMFVEQSIDNNDLNIDPLGMNVDEVKMCTSLPVPPDPTQRDYSEVKTCTTLPISTDIIETKSSEFKLPKAMSSVHASEIGSGKVKLSRGKPYTNPLATISLRGKARTSLQASMNQAKTRPTEATKMTWAIQPTSTDPLESAGTNEVKVCMALPLVDTGDNTSENVSSKFSSSKKAEKENDDISSSINFPMDESQAQMIIMNRTRKKRRRETRARNSLEDLAFGRDKAADTSPYGSTKGDHDHEQKPKRRCSHCQTEKTPQWRKGPLGKGTLCNACGVRFKSGKLLPEYRPAGSPSFDAFKHSNFHREVLKMRSNEKASLRS